MSALDELVAEWRRRTKAIGRDVGSYRQCANELEAALSATPPKGQAVAVAKLVREYRPTMDKDVLHSWASDVVAALASPAPAGRGVEGWQDIATAPKDGSAILALNSRHIAHPPVVVRWRAESILDDDAEPHWCDAATARGEALYYNDRYFDYWMSLPAAPTEGK